MLANQTLLSGTSENESYTVYTVNTFYTVYTVYTVYTDYTVYTVFNVYTIYIVCTVYTVHTVYTVFTAYTIETTLQCFNSSICAYIYCYEVRANMTLRTSEQNVGRLGDGYPLDCYDY